MSQHGATQCSFRFVEILIVLVVMLIMIGLLMPAITAPRIESRSHESGNNLKQIYMILLAHAYGAGTMVAAAALTIAMI